MANPNAMLDKMTRILAYVGDEGAKDGYFLRRNNAGNPIYSTNIRPESIPEELVAGLVKKIVSLLTRNKPIIGVPQDIIVKISELKVLYDSSEKSTKGELIDYLGEFEGNSGMHGGARKTKRRFKNIKNRKTRSRK